MIADDPSLIEATVLLYTAGQMPKLISAEELSAKTYVPKETILKLSREGKFPCVVIPGRDEPLYHAANAIEFTKSRLFKYQEAGITHLHIHADSKFPISEVPRSIAGLADKLIKFDLLNDLPCIYFLCQGNDVVYVGKSTNLAARLPQHPADKVFDRVFYLIVRLEELDRIEGEYIRALSPRYNGTMPRVPEAVPVAQPTTS
jgi:hypothetical protein